MKQSTRFAAALSAAMMLLTACSTGGTQQGGAVTLEQAQAAFLEKVDVEYSYNLTKKMEEIRSNEVLGYRTAGSDAELQTGDMLKAEMEAIGLSDVTKDAFTLDTWTFETAQLTYQTADGTEKTVELGGYQTNFSTNGPKTFTVIDAGEGTERELKELDAEGKLVLIDINQRENWWINYPAYEAKLHGAAAVLAAQNGGYSEVSDDALNAQDICGPDDAPAFSISRTDALAIRAAMEQAGTNEATVTLNAQSRVERDGTSYNIVGTIPGKDPDAMVLMSAHYDSYFSGFQDDNAAIALMMGIAKAIKESGYQPEKTLVFCALAAEEWGVVNSRYDWSTGAYNQIFRVHPEWVGKVVADINFELPAMNEGDTTQIRTSYELKTFIERFKTAVPMVEGVFPNGIETIVPIQTWSDDFSFSIAGIPSQVTALRGGFAQTHYHSQFDNEDTYSEAAYRFHHNMYGMLMLAYDRSAVSPLDFSTRLSALSESMDEELMNAAQIDGVPAKEALDAAIAEAQDAANAAWDAVDQTNAAYLAALDAGETDKAAELYAQSRALNTQALAAFKYAEDTLVRLTWEDVSIFPHEHSQNNLLALDGAIAALEEGDGATALDEYFYGVDNNWYAYDWSRQTFDYFTDYALNQSADRLMWGAGRLQGHVDLFDVIRSVQSKEQGASFDAELETLRAARESEARALEGQAKHELESVQGLTELLKAMTMQ